MNIEDQGIVISAIKYADKGFIVKIFSKNHGIVKGLLSGQKKNSSICQAGNHITFIWSARLEEHLGRLKVEMEKPYPLLHYLDYSKICAIGSITSLIDKILPERHEYSQLYDDIIHFLKNLGDDEWLKNYVITELNILTKCGFGIDFEHCAVSLKKEDTYFISPKTGACVSYDAGKPYQDKLFTIPLFLKDNHLKDNHLKDNHLKDSHPKDDQANCDNSELLDGLKITRYFLAKYFFSDNNGRLPQSCENFFEEIVRINERRDSKRA